MDLVALAAELDTKARELREMTYDTVVGETAGKPLNQGSAAALEDIAAQIRQINSEASSPEEAIAQVRELSAALTAEAAQANAGQQDLPDVMTFLLNPGKMLETLRDTGRQDGRRKAAEIIKHYLAEPDSRV